MKNLNLKSFSLLILIVIATSCSKDDDENQNPAWWSRDYWGEVSVNVNGSLWQNPLILGFDHSTDSTLIVHPGLAMVIDVYESELIRETLDFSQVPCEIGEFELYSIDPDSTDLPRVVYLTILADGDVLGDVYNVDPSNSNTIEIEELIDDEIFGSFNLTLIRDLSRPPTSVNTVDTIRFTEGSFHTRLTSR